MWRIIVFMFPMVPMLALNLFQLWNRPWRTVDCYGRTRLRIVLKYLALSSQLLIAQVERSAPLRLWPVAQGLPDRHGHRRTIDMRSIGPQKLKITYSFAVAIKPRYNFCQRIVQLGKKDVRHADSRVRADRRFRGRYCGLIMHFTAVLSDDLSKNSLGI